MRPLFVVVVPMMAASSHWDGRDIQVASDTAVVYSVAV